MLLKPFLVALREKLLEDFYRDGEVEVGVCLDRFKRYAKLNRRNEPVRKDAAVAEKWLSRVRYAEQNSAELNE